MIAVPLAYGEIFDKLTILELKQVRIPDQAACSRVGNELHLILQKIDNDLPAWRDDSELEQLLTDLRRINGRLWNLENRVRKLLFEDKRNTPEFSEASGEIFGRNEQRAQTKRRINLLLESGLVEEKHHAASAASSLGLTMEFSDEDDDE